MRAGVFENQVVVTVREGEIEMQIRGKPFDGFVTLQECAPVPHKHIHPSVSEREIKPVAEIKPSLQPSSSLSSRPHPPRRGSEGCPPPTMNLYPRKERTPGTQSTTNNHRPAPVPCDPQLTMTRALSIHRALKTRMSRSCRRKPGGRRGW